MLGLCYWIVVVQLNLRFDCWREVFWLLAFVLVVYVFFEFGLPI